LYEEGAHGCAQHLRTVRETLVWIIAGLTLVAILVRPLRMSEWIWSAAGAALLVISGLLAGTQAAQAARDGLDVYCFLAGMLTLAEIARIHRLLDAFSRALARRANGRGAGLFIYAFVCATAVTALLSNDGTILLLTPAAFSLARATNLSPRPFAYAVAFVANAASFILPIGNPANLVVFSPLPPLLPWLALFAAPSAAALLCTFAVLRVVHAREIAQSFTFESAQDGFGTAARVAALAVCVSLALLVGAAGFGWPLGYIALALGVLSLLAVGAADEQTPAAVLREGPWTIIPLVAGLFVIVRALDATGALELARALLRQASAMPPVLGRLYAGGVTAVGDAIANNLPVGVIARYTLHGHGVSTNVAHAVLVGVDLGPNLSISGSLATLLWVMMLRREGVEVNAWRFLRVGALVTIPSLLLALAVLQ
jgi:arsenical pump membrane protein